MVLRVIYVSSLKTNYKIYIVTCKLVFILFISPDWLEMAALTWWLTSPITTLNLSTIIMWFGGQLLTVELLSSLISRYVLFLKHSPHEGFYFCASLKSTHLSSLFLVTFRKQKNFWIESKLMVYYGRSWPETVGDQGVEMTRSHGQPWFSHYTYRYPLNKKCGVACNKDMQFYSIVSKWKAPHKSNRLMVTENTDIVQALVQSTGTDYQRHLLFYLNMTQQIYHMESCLSRPYKFLAIPPHPPTESVLISVNGGK